MSRNRIAGASVLALTAILLPPYATAVALNGAPTPTVVSGIWFFKGLLLLHAGVLVAAGVFRPRDPGGLLRLPPSDRARPAMSHLAALIGLLTVGAALRLHALGEGLWYDEIQTLVEYVRLPLGQILTTFDSQNQHLLYSILAHVARGALGDGAVALRVPAAIFGVLSLWALYRFAREITSSREALLATALLTFSYHHVWFSQNARGYTGLLLWTLVGSTCFVRLLRDPQKSWGLSLGYGASMALACYTHVTAAVVVLAHGVILLGLQLARRGQSPGAGRAAWGGLLLAVTLSLQLYALVLPQLGQTLVHPGAGAAETAWQNPVWLVTETLRGLSRGLPGGWVVLTGGGLVVLAGLFSYWRESAALTAMMLLPAALTAAAIMALHHNLWPRFFLFSAGFGVLIVVRGLFVPARALWPSRGELLATTATGLVVFASALTVPRAWQPKQDYEGAASFLDRAEVQNDAVVTVDLTEYPYEKYLVRPWRSVDSLQELEEIEQAHSRTWVLYTFPIRLAAVHPDIWARLASRYDTAAVYPGTVGGGAIVIMVTQ